MTCGTSPSATIARGLLTQEETEKRLEQLETVVEKMNRGLEVARRSSRASPSGTPSCSQDAAADATLGLGSTVPSRVHTYKKTFTEVYAGYF